MPSLRQLHKVLCYRRAFPKSTDEWRNAHQQLLDFEKLLATGPRSEIRRLLDSGIAGTSVCYSFSYTVARWLARRAPGKVSIDWQAMDDTARLDELLTRLLLPAEDEYFDGGYVTSQEWLGLASSNGAATDFDWLLAQLNDKRLQPFWAQMYDAIDLPLVWDLSDSRFSKSRNARLPVCIESRGNDMRARPRLVKREIQRPLTSIKKLPPRDGAKLIDVAMASLAVRHRETYHFNFANPKDVFLADVGAGTSVAVFGLLPDCRYPLECTMGFLLLSNGVPIGYGGSSILFKQNNTGINIFDEYRRSEAAFLWVQVMRTYYALTRCTRFIANPYQFGADNDEALQSGAFWFYYRLGYRPVAANIRKIALREARRLDRDRTYRSDIGTLRKLASCDMHLSLPGARVSELFKEEWLETSSMLASRQLAAVTARTRGEAARQLSLQLQRDLNIRSFARWTAAERHAFDAIAPVIAAVGPKSWSLADKRRLRLLLRAKGSNSEVRYAKLLCQHDKLLISLQKVCKRAGAEQD